ncbi:septation protein SepH [Jatrophihabitans sp.]|uniref:septation protein SepH n=1 Tax=Jatrophihabitans sp. TaxID=1932789 RepID=UPI002C649F8A|nr:septation protein SepH [Jatrophihabitans sp.]
MRELRLVGPGEDGATLVVEAIDAGTLEGERFTLALDQRLRTMATEPPPQQSDSEPAESKGPTPTPREIQVRVRAGESAEALAADAGIPLERVMRFALPVLQERIRVTDEARRARARRSADGLLVPFGELVDGRLARHGVDPSAARWDAYRREDGGWTVTAEFTSPRERTVLAKFSFALLNRTVSALEDIAADLLSDRPVQALLVPPPPVVEEPPTEPSAADWAPDWDAAPLPPRLTAVPNPSRAETPRPQEASPAVRPPSRRQKAHTRPVPVAADDELFDQDAFEQQPWHEPPLPFETGTASARPPRHARQSAGDAASSEAVLPAQPDLATGAERAGAQGSPAPEQLDLAPAEESVEPASPHRAPSAPAATGGAGNDDEVSHPAPAHDDLVGARAGAGDPQGKRGRRSGEKPRMPSWDDILLGVRHKSD